MSVSSGNPSRSSPSMGMATAFGESMDSSSSLDSPSLISLAPHASKTAQGEGVPDLAGLNVDQSVGVSILGSSATTLATVSNSSKSISACVARDDSSLFQKFPLLLDFHQNSGMESVTTKRHMRRQFVPFHPSIRTKECPRRERTAAAGGDYNRSPK